MLTTQYLYKLAAQGDKEAQFEIGYRLAFGRKTAKAPPWPEILTHWKAAANQKHTRAIFYLATCYDNGLGTEQNLTLAFKLYLQAAKAGHRDSQYNVGFFYQTGEVFAKDYNKMVHWFTMAAKAGLIDAQRDVGYAYFYGNGVKANYAKAIFWYRKAAAMNDAKALYNLGLCYKLGDGVKKSKRWARYYFTKAVAFGHQEAKRQLTELQEH